MKSNYIVRAKQFIMQVYPYLEGKMYSPYLCYHAIEKFNSRRFRKVQVMHGVSRIALITSDYVIKFDYNEEEVARVGGCESEVAFYRFAEHEGFAHLFAEITPFSYHGQMFYIMPRVHGIGRYEGAYAEDITYGLERYFLGRFLHDLHDENYGWYNGRLVIIDYACNVFQQAEESYDEWVSKN